MKEIKLFIYHKGECDAKRCTSLKMARFNLAKITNRIRGVLLNPFAKKILSKEDLLLAEKGITVLDCSWKNAAQSFIKKQGRRLPILLSSNPINYGKRLKLSSLEAFSAALYIFGYKEQSEKILSIYKWGIQFLNLNKNLLEDYANTKNEEEIIEIEKSYF